MALTYFLWHIVFANLLLLFTLALLLYKNIKDKTLLFYALYNVSLLLYIFLKSKYFFEYYSVDYKYKIINWWIQIIYNSFLSYFGINFLNIKKSYPKVEKKIILLIKMIMIVGSIGCFLAMIWYNSSIVFNVFSFVYLPVQLTLSIYILYLAYKIPKHIKRYYLTGVLAYILFAMFAFVLSFQGKHRLGVFTPISFFYIGVLIEQFAFVCGIIERIKNIYVEKIKYEKQLAKTQSQLNKELEKKIEIIEMERKLTNLEFTMITSQMNSHFIFNALNSVKAYIIENDKRKATEYLSKFSSFTRKVLEISSVKNITLEEELYIAQLYIDIEDARFNYTLNFKIVVNDTIPLELIKVPPFILQPFLENSIWHGVASKKDKEITLSISQENETVIIEIIDNGIGRKKAMEIKRQKIRYKKPIGLNIVSQILTYYYGKRFSLKYIDLYDRQNIPTGTRVILKIPSEK